MKNLVIVLLALSWLPVFSQNPQRYGQGIGIRIGTPVGISYKKYIGRHNSAEVIVGGASPLWNGLYYRNSFGEYSNYDNYRYLSHKVESTAYVQGRYLAHFDLPIEGMEGMLEWYWGLGAVMKIAKLEYTYNDPTALPPTRSDVRTDFDFGPEGIIGSEYHFEDVPITLFLEGSLMLELFDRIGAARPFAGVGVRYNFR